MMQRKRTWMPAAVILAAGALSACGSTSGARGDGLLPNPFGGGESRAEDEQDGIGVNSFLWRATLDTLSFMPLTSADPFGGVIITDWYSDPEMPNERFKATVYILDTRLRADALNVSVFRQVRGQAGWQDAASSPDTSIQIENAILRRAREIRLSTLDE